MGDLEIDLEPDRYRQMNATNRSGNASTPADAYATSGTCSSALDFFAFGLVLAGDSTGMTAT